TRSPTRAPAEATTRTSPPRAFSGQVRDPKARQSESENIHPNAASFHSPIEQKKGPASGRRLGDGFRPLDQVDGRARGGVASNRLGKLKSQFRSGFPEVDGLEVGPLVSSHRRRRAVAVPSTGRTCTVDGRLTWAPVLECARRVHRGAIVLWFDETMFLGQP